MRCGAKCFQIEIALQNNRKITSVNARTPANARRLIKKKYGSHVTIISAIEKRQGK